MTCTCPTDHVHALELALRGDLPALCPEHDAAEITRQDAQREADQLRAATHPARHLHVVPDPLEQTLTAMHPPRDAQRLGQHPSAYPATAGFRNDDGPDAA